MKILKKDFKKKALKRYQSLSKEGKEKKQPHGCKQYKNLSEDKKQKLVKYSKKYYKTRKKCLTIIKRNYYIKKK